MSASIFVGWLEFIIVSFNFFVDSSVWGWRGLTFFGEFILAGPVTMLTVAILEVESYFIIYIN